MQDIKASILVTRPVPSSLVEQAKQQHVLLEAISFIETESIDSIEVQQEIELAAIEYATVIFTSANAVEAVTRLLDGMIPDWQIYCLNHHTKKMVAAYFGESLIIGTADTATALADEIMKEDEKDGELIFFCGNQRRQELPEKLRAAGIALNEIMVYQTIATPRKLQKDYDAVLFFSPSAVESFFTNNKPKENCILFAIGATTKAAIDQYSQNKTIVAVSPEKEKLVEQAIQYFS
jgi:uroporphyrinogen-III synthase